MRGRTHNRPAAVFLSLLIALTGCGSAGGNPLIGEWQLSEGDSCPYERLVFTPSQKTSHRIAIGPNPPEKYTAAVAYTVEGSNVIVHGQGTGAGAMTYVLSDSNTMRPNDSHGCTYSRVGST